MKKLALVINVLLPIMLVAVGLIKLLSPIDDLHEGMAWTLEFDTWQVRALGVLELLAAIGIFVPLVLKRLYGMMQLALAGVILLMLGAIGTHLSIDDPIGQAVPAAVVLLMSVTLLTLRTRVISSSQPAADSES